MNPIARPERPAAAGKHPISSRVHARPLADAGDAQAGQITPLQSQVNAAFNGSSNNSNGVSTLGLTITNNPPQQFEVQPIADKVDELINALRR